MIEAAVRSLILAALPDVPVFVGVAAKGTQSPYIVIYPMSEDPQYTHDGPSSRRKISIQTSCFAMSYTQAKAISSSIRNALNILGTVTVAGTNIYLGLLDTSHYIYEDDTALHHVAHRFVIHYSEAE